MRFSAEHIWVRLDDDNLATVGISEEAFMEGEDITKVQLASEGEELIKDERFGRLITSRPSLFPLFMPLTGDLIEINEEITEAPDMILGDPYEEGWLIRISISNFSEFEDLMSQTAYTTFVGGDFTAVDELEDDGRDDDDDELDPYDDDDF